MQIILLNGPTCSGKTTIARLLRERSSAARVLMQIDEFVAMLPERYVTPPCPDDRNAILTQLRKGFHDSIASMAAQGVGVIVDTVMAEPGWLGEWLDVFEPFSVLFVGVYADLVDLERREALRQRADDIPGTAKRHFHTVHEGVIYDVRIDTSRQSAGECANAIMAFLLSERPPTAFNELRRRRGRSG